MTELARLLEIIGRQPDEPCTILTQPAGGTGLSVEWTTVELAPGVAAAHAGKNSVWFGVQPVRASTGRGKAADVTSLVTLYADLDYMRPGKPDGLEPAVAAGIMIELGHVLGAQPSVIVRSGNGIQPYWPVESMDPLSGAQLLLWWREQVIKVASEFDARVDTGVFDLARILRVPGPPNMKTAGDPRPTGLIVPTGADQRRLSIDEVREAVERNPAAGPVSRAGRNAGVTFGARVGSDPEDRVFTAEQAQNYLMRADGPVMAAKNTPHGAGFNDALNRACFEIAAFVPVFLSEDEAWDLACSVVEAQFPGGPDGNDVGTIKSGFSQNGWVARAPTESEAANPFSAYADTKAIVAAQGGLRVATPRSATVMASRATVAAADAAVSAVMNAFADSTSLPGAVEIAHPMEVSGLPIGGFDADGRPQPGADCYLPEAFWSSRKLFSHLRNAAWSAMASPEGVVLAALALIASRAMPNVKLGAPVGAPASLNHMFVLCGDSSDGKSTCRKVANRALKFAEDDVRPHSFGPSSGQGIGGQFQRLVKTAGQPPVLVRTRWAAFAHVEESDTMSALLANKTNTIGADLRKGAFGEELSYGNIGDTMTNIPEHGYRLIFWMCMQPELSEWLLGTSAGGLPQRFVWGCVRDPRIVDGVTHPGLWDVLLPFEAKPDAMDVPRLDAVMSNTDRITGEIREAARQRKLHGAQAGEEYDGHAMLNRFKIAGHIALADGRLAITDEDWDLSLMVMVASAASLRWVRAVVAWAGAEEARKVALGRGKSRIIEESVVKTHEETGARKKVADAVLRFLGRSASAGMSKADLRRKIQAADRHLLDEGVLDGLLETGAVRFEDITKDGQQAGSRWFLT